MASKLALKWFDADAMAEGFMSAEELDKWLETLANPVNDAPIAPDLARFRPFISAMADLLVQDLIRNPPGSV